ncbi:hypothetical protein MSAN_01132700 [Mycena sanguinolenta]|uniref:Uncharacterized protein n=1 Tax=Mycena sanguinolenta TaxID=230812 RepID=A0A8H6YMH8_9AGAR|nr:hypothetical protein MSAN_01132700 [Mycena sanguinolenta]
MGPAWLRLRFSVIKTLTDSTGHNVSFSLFFLLVRKRKSSKEIFCFVLEVLAPSVMASPWSHIPSEIACEIAKHNADDAKTLRAMSLVSRTTRFSVIEYIFAAIHFACVEDFFRWLDILARTPMLATTVKKVKFSQPDKDWLRRRRGLTSATVLRDYSSPPIIPALPIVRSVEWDGINLTNRTIKMMVSHTELFPSLQGLRLTNMEFVVAGLTHLLGASGHLKSLRFERATPKEDKDDSDPEGFSGFSSNEAHGIMASQSPTLKQAPFDLTALEDLVIIDSSEPAGNTAILRLLQYSQPSQLDTLSFGVFNSEESYSFQSTESLLRFVAPSLVNLVVDASFPYADDRDLVLGMLSRLPAFTALESLTLWAQPFCNANDFITGIEAAPNLTALIFRMILYNEDEEADREELEKILVDLLPTRPTGSESMMTTLSRKFPRCQRVEFHFCIPEDSDMHFRRGLRRRMERRVKERVDEIGAGIGDFLKLEWLDEQYNPVRYNQTNGKPPWKLTASWWEEPETEAGDCESQKSGDDSDEYDSDENPVIREWTEAHERAYRREMLAECFDGYYYSDEEDTYEAQERAYLADAPRRREIDDFWDTFRGGPFQINIVVCIRRVLHVAFLSNPAVIYLVNSPAT